jgi:hypothetical protein
MGFYFLEIYKFVSFHAILILPKVFSNVILITGVCLVTL